MRWVPQVAQSLSAHLVIALHLYVIQTLSEFLHLPRGQLQLEPELAQRLEEGGLHQQSLQSKRCQIAYGPAGRTTHHSRAQQLKGSTAKSI